MKTTIYYFSGTGNSLHVAKELSKKIENSEIKPIVKMMQENNYTAESQRIGFVFPIYYWGLPKIVEDFIKIINFQNPDYIFYVSVSGGESSNDCVSGKIKKILHNKKLQLNGGFRIVMPGNYIKMYDIDNPELQAKKLQQSKIRIKSIAKKINSNLNRVKKDKNIILAKLVNNIWQQGVNKSDKTFSVSYECNSCGTCKNICPVNNINLIDGKPVWNHKCQECYACIHFCSKKAIKVQSEKKTEKGRYKHPDVTVKDLIQQKK